MGLGGGKFIDNLHVHERHSLFLRGTGLRQVAIVQNFVASWAGRLRVTRFVSGRVADGVVGGDADSGSHNVWRKVYADIIAVCAYAVKAIQLTGT